MRNWKTSLFGALILAAKIVAPLAPSYSEALNNAAEVLMGAGLLAAADAPRKPKRERD